MTTYYLGNTNWAARAIGELDRASPSKRAANHGKIAVSALNSVMSDLASYMWALETLARELAPARVKSGRRFRNWYV